MSDGHVKCKIISFRVSDDEYKRVEELRQKHGFPSVSLFSRFATLKYRSAGLELSQLDLELKRLWNCVEQALVSALRQITARSGGMQDASGSNAEGSPSGTVLISTCTDATLHREAGKDSFND
jgi:hypothetical protein